MSASLYAQSDNILVSVIQNRLIYHDLDQNRIKEFTLSNSNVNGSSIRSLEYNPDLCLFHAIVDFRSTPKLYNISIYGEVSFVANVTMAVGSPPWSCEGIAYNQTDQTAYVSLSFPTTDYFTETIAEINLTTGECSNTNTIVTNTPRPDDADFLEVYNDTLIIGDGEAGPAFTYVFGLDLANRTGSMSPTVFYQSNLNLGFQELAVINNDLYVEYNNDLYSADLTQRPLQFNYIMDLNYNGMNGRIKGLSNFNYDEIFDELLLPNDTTICSWDSIVVNMDQYPDFIWDNNTTGERVLRDEGIYYGYNWLGSCLFRSDTLQLTVIPCDSCKDLKSLIDTVKTISANSIVECRGDSVLLKLDGEDGWDILWSTGAIGDSIWVKDAGEYSATFVHGDCSFFSDTIFIDFVNCNYCDSVYSTIESQLIFSYSGQRCLQDPINISLPNNMDSVLWNDGSTSFNKLINSSGTYYALLFYDSCEFSTDTFNVQFIDCELCNVFFPNAFSPNDDGINEVFRAVLHENCDYSFEYFEVYNRWGERLLESTEPVWDGYFMDEKCQQDVYFFVAKGVNNYTSKISFYSGLIHLVR